MSSRTGSRIRKPTEKAATTMQEKKTRRTRDEIARDKEVEEQRKRGEAEAKQENIGQVAAIEDRMAFKDTQAMGAHPRHISGML